ncbi:MAG TPA: hypothetical protein VNC40_05515 [Gaiellaceae bacterium]|nr:hypothetical protein [Gaiellaceae bacterium]
MRYAPPVVCAAVLLAVLAGCGGASRVVAHRVELAGSSLRCDGAPYSVLDYHWPVRPFNVQHPIRGGFGDPRTLTTVSFGVDDLGDPGDFSFHNGVDIAAGVGRSVYPVVSGRATVVGGDEVRVRAGRRVFQYHHIAVAAAVHDGEYVIAGVTVLGTIRMPFRHVHLTEIDRGRVTNPLLHLRPYADHTIPVVHSVTFATPAGQRADPGNLTGDVTAVAEADDLPPVPVPGAWDGFPLAPALVRSALIGGDGTVVWSRTAADFRHTEPPRQDFWRVYAPGTFQNFPVFADHYYYRQPGRYLFLLTGRRPLDTRRFANGSYTLRVVAEDVCGNRSVVSQEVRIRNNAAA